MKKLVITLVLFLFVAGNCLALSLTEESKIDNKGLKSIVGDKIIDMRHFSISREECTAFVIGRDNETRKWQWFLIDPFAKKLLKTGDCPFTGLYRCSLSPDGSYALAISQYNTALWHLDLKTEKWKQLYRNPKPKEDGLALRFFSNLIFGNSSRAFSIMEMWDSEHYVTDTFITMFTCDPFKMDKLASFDKLRKNSIKMAMEKLPKNAVAAIDLFVYGDENSFVFTLKTQSKTSREDYTDYLMQFQSPDKLTILDKGNARIMPLDYKVKPMTLLYSYAAKGKMEVILVQDGKKQTLIEGIATAGRIMKDNLIGLAKSGKKEFSIMLGVPGEKFKNMKTFDQQFRIEFIEDGTRLVLINKDFIRCFKIVK